MNADRTAAGYCPDCEHLLDNDDVVRIVGRHMDGLDPTFRCPACDGDLAHPSRAPDSATFYASASGHAQGSPGSTTPEDPERTRALGDAGSPLEPGGITVVAEQRPPLRLEEVREGDRITVHFDRPGMAALQTKAGDVTGVRRSPAGTPTYVRFETDTLRRCSIDVGPGASLTEGGTELGRIVEVVVTRASES